jgi:hypothetical protein
MVCRPFHGLAVVSSSAFPGFRWRSTLGFILTPVSRVGVKPMFLITAPAGWAICLLSPSYYRANLWPPVSNLGHWG